MQIFPNKVLNLEFIMKLAYFIKKESLRKDARVNALLDGFRTSGYEIYPVRSASDVTGGTFALMSLGGDGTFLDAARIAVPVGIPVIGVNFGRLGFLSENTPEDVLAALKAGEYSVEERTLLKTTVNGEDPGMAYALNEVSVSRVSPAMLGIDVRVDGAELPTYWADGLLVATSSGSTAYSLSVGGPICTPDAKVLIVAPVAPHNLNVRPLVIPESSKVRISLKSRDANANFTMDNSVKVIPADASVVVEAAPVRLLRLRLGKSNFIQALRGRLLWGEDVRNSSENS